MPRRVLMVDDDLDIRLSLRFLLEDAGYEVEEVSTGSEALTILQQSEHELLVLLDRYMPGTDGITVLHTVQANPDLSARHRFALMTARATGLTDEDRGLLELMQVPLIEKPFDIDHILAVLSQMEQRQ